MLNKLFLSISFMLVILVSSYIENHKIQPALLKAEVAAC